MTQTNIATVYTDGSAQLPMGVGRVVGCGSCRSNRLCIGENYPPGTFAAIDGAMHHSGLMPSGHALYHQGDDFTTLFAVRSGFFKTVKLGPDGTEQVLGFNMPGDLVGFDAIHEGRHRSSVIALCSASVCAFEYRTLVSAAMEDPNLQHRMFSLMSEEITRHMDRLGDATADKRMARFLLELSGRFEERGFSPNRLNLFMPRRDIGDHLRLATETVSRVLTRFQQEGLIRVSRREITLQDVKALKAIAHTG